MEILVVEDNPDSLHMLSRLLDKRGHKNVSAVTSGALAIEALETKKFDVVICDYQMPDVTGHEVFKILKDAGSECRFLLWTNAELHELPKFEGFGFLGAVRKTELDKIFGTLASVKHQLSASC